MRDLATFLKPFQIMTKTQNDLQHPFNNSKPFEILGDTLNRCLPHLFKISTLLVRSQRTINFLKN
jgi:hypothetical protein